MPCNAIATIKTRLAMPTTLSEAAKELNADQAKALYLALLKELGTGEINQSNLPFTEKIILTGNDLRVTIYYDDYKGKQLKKVEIEAINSLTTPAKITARFNEQTIKAAGLIRQAKAIQAIKAQYLGSQTLNAPNGATIITLDI